jgi:hypothetical protein
MSAHQEAQRAAAQPYGFRVIGITGAAHHLLFDVNTVDVQAHDRVDARSRHASGADRHRPNIYRPAGHPPLYPCAGRYHQYYGVGVMVAPHIHRSTGVSIHTSRSAPR